MYVDHLKIGIWAVSYGNASFLSPMLVAIVTVQTVVVCSSL